MKILLASTNPHKLDEILAIWSACQQAAEGTGVPVEWVALDVVDPGRQIPEPVEDQPTFEANAVVKARHYALATGMQTIADDSGLEVDALGGRPGVLSARYAGASGPREVVDQANNQRLMHELAGVPGESRVARFVCAMALCGPWDAAKPDRSNGAGVGRPNEPVGSGPVRVFALVRGTIEGRIVGSNQEASSKHGFGYDPLFLVPELGETTAQLDPDQKNAISHRGQAARSMWQQIQSLGGDPALWRPQDHGG